MGGASPEERISTRVLFRRFRNRERGGGVGFVMLDDVYDYTMIYHKGSWEGLPKVWWVGWSAGRGARVAGPVYEFGISVSGKWALG